MSKNGSSKAEDTLKQEIIEILKSGIIKEIDRIKNYLEYIEIVEIDGLIFERDSNFSRNFQNFIRNFKNKSDFYDIRDYRDFFYSLNKLGSKQVIRFLTEEVITHINKSKLLTDLEPIHEFFKIFNKEDLMYIFEIISKKFFDLIISSLDTNYNYDNAKLIGSLSNLGNNSFNFIKEVINKLEETKKKQFILSLFTIFEYSYFGHLSKEDKKGFLAILNPKDLFKYTFDFISDELRDTDRDVFYPELDRALKMLIKARPQQFNEVYEEELSLRKEQDILEILLYLLFKNCFKHLPVAEVESYFNSFNIEILAKTLKVFIRALIKFCEIDYDEFIHHTYYYIDFSKLGKIAVDLIIYLLKISDESILLDSLIKNIRDFKKSFYPIIYESVFDYSQNQENFETYSQFIFFFSLLEVIEEEHENEILLESKLNLIELIFTNDIRLYEDDHEKFVCLFERDYHVKDPVNNIVVKSFIEEIIFKFRREFIRNEFISNFLNLISVTDWYSVLEKYKVIEYLGEKYQKHYIFEYFIKDFLMLLFLYVDLNTIRRIAKLSTEELRGGMISKISGELDSEYDELDDIYIDSIEYIKETKSSNYNKLNKILGILEEREPSDSAKFLYYYENEKYTYRTKTKIKYATERYLSQIEYTIGFSKKKGDNHISCILESHQPHLHSVSEIKEKGVILLEQHYISYVSGIKHSTEYDEIYTEALLGFWYWTEYSLDKDDEEGRIEYVKKLANEINELIDEIVGDAKCYSMDYYDQIDGQEVG